MRRIVSVTIVLTDDGDLPPKEGMYSREQYDQLRVAKALVDQCYRDYFPAGPPIT